MKKYKLLRQTLQFKFQIIWQNLAHAYHQMIFLNLKLTQIKCFNIIYDRYFFLHSHYS